MKMLLYIGMMILTVYLGVMYRWQESIWLLSGEIVFPFLCMGLAWLAGRKITVEMEQHADTAERGEEIPVQIRIVNDGWIPALLEIQGSVQSLSGIRKMTKQRIQILPRKIEQLPLRQTAEVCGKLQVGIAKLKVFDCWGFLSVRRSCEEQTEIMVMPKPYPMNLVISNRTKWFPIDGESYAEDRSGDDTAELYEVREYRTGDRLQKVHWKLSAKEQKLYIKEFSYPLGAAVVILLEGGAGKESMEAFFEMVVSFSTALFRLECPHYMVWKNKMNGQVQRMLIRKEEDFQAFLMELLQFEEKSLENNVEEYYRYTYKSDTYSTLLHIATDLTVRVNQEESMRVKQEEVETFFETVEIVV